MTESRLVQLALVIAVIFAARSADAGIIPYHLTGLGNFAGQNDSGAVQINDNGQVTGDATVNGTPFAFRWTSGGGLQNLGKLNGDFESYGLGIGANGQVVGQSDLQVPITNHAFLWTSANGMQNLGTLPGMSNAVARGVNGNGQVVGSAFSQTSYAAFLWTSANGMQNLGRLLATPSNAVVAAISINTGGEVVGFSGSQAFAWTSSGGMQGLGFLPGGSASLATGINDLGQVVGYATTSTGATHVFLWSLSTGMQDLGGLSGLNYLGPQVSDQFAINNKGQIVGFENSTSGTSTWTWTSTTGWQNLNNLLDSSGAGWSLQNATGINNSGQIVGLGLDPSHNYQAFLLTPVPEPSSIVSLMLGAAALGSVTVIAKRRGRTIQSLRTK